MSKKLLLSIFSVLVFGVCAHIAALATATGSDEFILPTRNPKAHPVIQKQIDEGAEEPLNVWVLFTDKGVLDEASFLWAARRYEQSMLERTKWRRRLRARHGMVDLPDLPVSEKYVKGIIKLDAKHRATSRWLNAVSVSASPDVIKKIAKLKYVRAIDPVAKGQRPAPPESEDGSGSSKYQKAPSQPVPPEGGLNYGGSAPQIQQINVHKLHDMGYHGEGVIVGVLDTGFDLSHEVFQHLEVIAEHDFIHNDDITANEPGQDTSGQDSHGTSVLSILSGYSPGNLIGPAFAARYLLAKTEEASFERQVEEDWWVEAIEWLEMEGAEAASTSLGYCDWYKTADLDGRTAKITIAADMAVDRGVTMVVLMGNAGQGCEFMWPPADGFKVISVGAVDVNGIVSGFSMRGPTADGRIKPDVMARGTIGTVMAEPHSTSDYKSNTRGTSFATPLVAGTAALLLQAFPTATPADIALALKSTASNASAPNNDYGWGIVNAEAAYEFLVENIAMSETVPPVAISDLSTAGKKPGSIALITTFGYIKQTALFQNYPNPFNPETWIPYRLANDAHVVIWIYDSAGCLIRELNLGQRKAGFYLDKDKAAYWDGKNSLGEQVASGAYFYRLEAGDFVAIRKLAIVK